MIPQDILHALQQELGWQVHEAKPLGGGCIHHAHRITCQQGTFFLKWNSLGHAHLFEVEAKGLELLGSTACLYVPQVLHAGQTSEKAFLVLEFIQSGPKAPDYWQQLGRGLACLHAHSSPLYGLPYDNYIGSLPQSNRQHSSWPDFFVAERLAPMLKLARQKGHIDERLQQQFEKLFRKMPELIAEEKPALIHGDLWGGNLMIGPRGEPVVFDPAVYYAHREIELAFMNLFDRQPPVFYEAYQEVLPLQPGWRERFDLYNLYPLLVHVNLFGSGYLNGVRTAMRKYV